MKQNKWLSIILLVILAALLTPVRVRADIAPPEQPPGTNIVPDSENTQVRMVAETVTLTVLSQPSPDYHGQADTEAVFTMRNLGSQTETMEARFPLTFWDGSTGGNWYPPPEIPDIRIFVDGKPVSTHRIEADVHPDEGRAPWAAFNVTFPPGKDVIITVKYTTNGYGYEPNFYLRYILETGAGWKDTIGSADIIVKLPYLATYENVGGTTIAGFEPDYVGNEIRWHYENFEPTHEDNINASLLIVSYWQKILYWRAQTQKTPNDGEAWGQLGKAIKASIRDSAKGYFYSGQTAEKLYAEAVQAYEKAVTLLPKDSLWHYGFANLLWGNASFSFTDKLHYSDYSRAVDELHKSLALDPKNKDAKEFADKIAGEYPWAIHKTDDGYDYLILTATPTFVSATAMPTPEATSTPRVDAPTQTAVPAASTDAPVSPTKTPGAGLPLCGGVGLVMLPALAVFWLAVKKKHATHF